MRKAVGVNVGDLLEAKVERGKITLTPKVVVDRGHYTPRQRRIVDARLAKALEEVKQGRLLGPFDTAVDMLSSLKGTSRKSAGRSTAR